MNDYVLELGLGTLASTIYTTSGAFAKVVSNIDKKLGEISTSKLTSGELTSLILTAGVGLTVAGLTLLTKHLYKNSKENSQKNSWLFERLK